MTPFAEDLPRSAGYDGLIAAFRWAIPERFNIAVAAVDQWADAEPDRPALLRYRDGNLAPISYAALKRDSDRLAHALRARDISPGDRVAILLPQSTETVSAHLATYKLGAIAVPLAALFGGDALRYRLLTAGAKALITDGPGLAKLGEIRADLPSLQLVICTDGPASGAEGYAEALAPFSEPFAAVPTRSDDPALLIFTSGTTGPPKGALHPHRVLLGHLPGFRVSHDFAPEPGDRMWTPSDWAWAGGLLNALLPSLTLGIPVVFGPFARFDPDAAYALMAETGVRNAFLPPTAVKMLAAAGPPRNRSGLNLRTLVAAGESLGREAYEWARAELGVTINEVYGQTECNYVLGSCAALGVTRAGSIGRPLPGHDVRILDAEKRETAPGEEGEISIRRPDPVMFLRYWNDPAATEAKFAGDWLLTGDRAVRDEDGYVRFVGRDDDIIISAGYRIGPSEVEDCLAGHPAVVMAAAVGKPDPLRTAIVKAYVVLKPGLAPTAALANEIKAFVRTRLSAAEYPREVEFVDELPLTTTGKVIRRALRERAQGEI